ncbi:MAG: sodium-dependent transporter, partial [Bacteroidaceae bacterium]|nr:sodium-dependent transporter [Bacteroidaceae bacterium]
LLGVVCSLSMGVWNDFRIGGLCMFDLFDFVSAKIILPLGGILICSFVGWKLNRQLVYDEVTNRGSLRVRLFGVYIFLVRWVAPLAIAVIFYNELFRK